MNGPACRPAGRFQALRVLRENEETKDLPVIIS